MIFRAALREQKTPMLSSLCASGILSFSQYGYYCSKCDTEIRRASAYSHIKTAKHQGCRVGQKPLLRATNGLRETKTIEWVVGVLNGDSAPDLGLRLREALRSETDLVLARARPREGGNRNTSYDFIVVDSEQNEYRVEYKGSCRYKRIKTGDSPWQAGVQVINLSADKVSLGKVYAKIWYAEYVGSGLLAKKYDLSEKVPTFNTWYRSDCCAQGNPRTLFGLALKAAARKGVHGLRPLRKKVNALFMAALDQNPDLLIAFADEMTDLIQEKFAQKDLWLQFTGNEQKCDFRWYSRQSVGVVTRVVPKYRSDFEFVLEGEGVRLKAVLRWGKGCGFSNLRIDVK